MDLTLENIQSMNSRYRANFINSLAGIKQAVLVGSKSTVGQNNLAIFNSLIHIGANPALYGLIFRPDTVRRDTLSNIIETGSYTLNYVKSADYKKAHQTSAKYPSHISEFDITGFTPQFKHDFHAPFVNEALIQIGMKFEKRLDIEINGTILIIGSIQSIKLSADLIDENGLINLAKADVLACSGLFQYFNISEIGKMPYAVVE